MGPIVYRDCRPSRPPAPRGRPWTFARRHRVPAANIDAIEYGITQPIVRPADLAVLKAEMLARMDELKVEIFARMDEKFAEFESKIEATIEARIVAKLRPIFLMTSVSLTLSIVSVALNCVILARL